MTDGMRALVGLVERGRAGGMAQAGAAPAPTLVTSVDALIEHALGRELGLALQGAWRLHSAECEALEARFGWRPAGGWRALAGLLAGSPVLRPEARRFVLRDADVQPGQWREGALRCALLEALTCHLVPPTTAAGLFLVMGIHPAWGLRLAATLHEDFCRPGEARPDAPTHALWLHQTFPPVRLEAVRHAIACALTVTLETLRTLDPHHRYPIDALGELVVAAAAFARGRLRERLDGTIDQGSPVLLDQLMPTEARQRERAAAFASHDLLDQVLVPAQIARRFDDDTFATLPDALDLPYRVDQLSRLERARLFAAFLGEAQAQVV